MWRIVAYDRDNREVNRLEADAGEVTIGRDPDRRLVLPSASVSRRHARIVLDGPQPYISDEGSANGVIVNGVRIAAPTAILAGIRVDIAEFHLEFQSGSPMTEAVAPLSAPMPSAAPGDALRLFAEGGPFDGRIFEVPMGESVVGRAVDNDIVIDDPSLSRKHARIRRIGPGRIEVEDLGSSNGTFVNGRKVGKGNASAGDAVRFGELTFRLDGPGGGVSTRDDQPVPASGSGWIIGAVIGAVVLLLGGGGAAYFLLKKPGGGKSAIDQIAEQAQQHVRDGTARLEEKKFDAASAEFAEALKLDPANKEARALKLRADAEPQNEKYVKSVNMKSSLSDRLSFEAAIRSYNQISEDSVFKKPTGQKLMRNLVAFGDLQCKSRKWSDCAFAMCRAYEVAPEGAKPSPDAEKGLREAEKKLAKDKSYTPCKKR